MSIWDELEYFSPEEFEFPDKMDHDFLRLLDFVRHAAKVPIYISSDYRPGDPKAHGKGLAVDIKDDKEHDGITSRWRFRVTQAAFQAGCVRIGVYDKHIHLDCWDSGPQGVLWVGTSS